MRFNLICCVSFPVRNIIVGYIVMLDGLGLVVRRQRQDEPHHGLQVPLQDLSGADLVHPDLLGGHELQNSLQIFSHSLQ